MKIRIVEETPEILPEYEKVSIAFRVETYFRVEFLEKGLGGVKFLGESIAKPFIKDYDAISEEKPSRLIERFTFQIGEFCPLLTSKNASAAR